MHNNLYQVRRKLHCNIYFKHIEMRAKKSKHKDYRQTESIYID